MTIHTKTYSCSSTRYHGWTLGTAVEAHMMPQCLSPPPTHPHASLNKLSETPIYMQLHTTKGWGKGICKPSPPLILVVWGVRQNMNFAIAILLLAIGTWWARKNMHLPVLFAVLSGVGIRVGHSAVQCLVGKGCTECQVRYQFYTGMIAYSVRYGRCCELYKAGECMTDQIMSPWKVCICQAGRWQDRQGEGCALTC